MHAFDVLGDPVRRRILEIIAPGGVTSGAVTDVINEEFGISQPGISQHLRVLRENGFATVRQEGTRRFYSIDPQGFETVSDWLNHMEQFWTNKLAALETEIGRGKRRGNTTKS
ncbi:MAG: transcriptional regulator [Ponticaulis sp.]|nr:transcriptional regulator [Ponticaulis sp.]|tara:strand:- start:84745 stop:85083 length:339 start_codon:yes stop_codon:yes gene_type:complete